MGRRIKKKRSLTHSPIFTFNFTQIVNCRYQIIGNNNSIDNANIQSTYKSFSFVSEINFTSRNGKIFYSVLMLLLFSLLVFCIVSLKPVEYIVAMTLIPTSFFMCGKKYLKEKEDEKHFKIHKILMRLIAISIVLFCIIAVCFSLIGEAVITTGCILMAFNLLTSFALYANALGGSKALDFVMGTFINFSEN